VGRQRNDDDCLGRNYWRRLRYGHRRQILRRCIGSDTHANTFSDPNRDSYGNCNGDAQGYTDSDCDGYDNSNANGYTHGYSELHAQVSTYAAATPDAGTSPLEVRK